MFRRNRRKPLIPRWRRTKHAAVVLLVLAVSYGAVRYGLAPVAWKVRANVVERGLSANKDPSFEQEAVWLLDNRVVSREQGDRLLQFLYWPEYPMSQWDSNNWGISLAFGKGLLYSSSAVAMKVSGDAIVGYTQGAPISRMGVAVSVIPPNSTPNLLTPTSSKAGPDWHKIIMSRIPPDSDKRRTGSTLIRVYLFQVKKRLRFGRLPAPLPWKPPPTQLPIWTEGYLSVDAEPSYSCSIEIPTHPWTLKMAGQVPDATSTTTAWHEIAPSATVTQEIPSD